MGIFLYIQSGRRQKKEKDVVFFGGAYLNAPSPPLWCVLPGTANMIFVFLVLCRPLKIKENIIKSINVSSI